MAQKYQKPTPRANVAIKEVSKMKFEGSNPKTRFGKMIEGNRRLNFDKAKMKTIKELGKSQLVKGIEAASGVAQSIVASSTARALKDKNSYTQGLAAWQKNFNGNPDSDKGSSGSTQSSSTSELGG